MCEHGHVQCRSPAQAQHPSPLHGAPGPGPLPLAPGPPLAAPGPHHNGLGPGPLPQAPTAAPVARGPPQPLTQFPVELGNFINKLPPARALEGGHPNIDQVCPSRVSTSLVVYTAMYSRVYRSGILIAQAPRSILASILTFSFINCCIPRCKVPYCS